MAKNKNNSANFNIFIVAQQGRLMYEALLFAASLRHCDPDFSGRLLVGEPQPGDRWPNNPTIQNMAVRELLTGEYGAEIVPFENAHFGASYPHGNKIEALMALPENEPFVFFDSDTLVTGPISAVWFDFEQPSASLRVEGTWPKPDLYGPGYAGIWRSLYDRFGLDYESSLDLSEPREFWRRHMYFNAGWFYYRCPREFGQRFLDYALAIRDDPGDALATQSLDPWLDQVALPLVVHSFGGGRDSAARGHLDGDATCHYRTFSLLYAREAERVVEVLAEVTAPNKLKKVLKQHEAIKRMLYQGRGQKVRALFDREALPLREAMIRNRIKKAGLWMR